MTEDEMFVRDIETLKDSIRIEYAESASKYLSPSELKQLRERIALLQADLKILRDRRDAATKK